MLPGGELKELKTGGREAEIQSSCQKKVAQDIQTCSLDMNGMPKL